VPHEVPVLQQKGKRVAPGTDEGPESKKLRTQRDSGFMVCRILALAKVYAPPSSQNPSTTMSPPKCTTLVDPPVDPAACLGAEPNSGEEAVVGDEVPSGGPPAHSLPGGEPDTFSQEFNKLQEEVASEREALEQISPAFASSVRPESPTPVPVDAALQTSTSFLPAASATAGRRRNFQTDGLAGCPLEALTSLVTSDYCCPFGQLPAEGYAEQLTGKILQVCDSVNFYLGCSLSSTSLRVLTPYFCLVRRGRRLLLEEPSRP
jgi:hypothetical protein